MRVCRRSNVAPRIIKLVAPVAAAAALGLAPAALSGQAAADAAEARARMADLADYIEQSMPDWDLPGLGVAVVYQDDVIFAEGFGVKELGRDNRVDAETLFQIGSVSKSFAAGSIGALVDDGLVDWDDPIVKHLPWFRVKDPWITRSMTIRDILSHRSGMPGDSYAVMAVIDARDAAERLRLLDNQAPLRQAYRYSNQGYGVAGLVVEAVTGMKWGDWVRERIFTPLGMHGSAASPYEVWDDRFVATAFFGPAPAGEVGITDAAGRNVAMPHGTARDGSRRVLSWQSYDAMQSAGSVVSSVTDLTNWIRLHLNRGILDGEVVLSESTISEMHTPQIPTDEGFVFGDGQRGAYGLGWRLSSFEGRKYVWHSGGIFGFPAYVAMLPEVGVGVAVLGNGALWTPYYPHQEVVARVFARVLGTPDRGLARRDRRPDSIRRGAGAGGSGRVGRRTDTRDGTVAPPG